MDLELSGKVVVVEAASHGFSLLRRYL